MRFRSRFVLGTCVLGLFLLGNNNGLLADTFSRQVSTGADDAEETLETTPDSTAAAIVGRVDIGSSDLELATDWDFNGIEMVGMRFLDLPIPVGSTINSASIQFTVDDTDSGNATKESHHRALGTVTFSGELSPNAATFTTTAFDISSRPDTSVVNNVDWSPPDWGPQSNVGAAGADQLSPNLASILQEIVDQGGWASGNAAVFFVAGNGDMTRESESANGSSSGGLAPILNVDFTPVPEPGAVLLSILGMVGMLLFRKRS